MIAQQLLAPLRPDESALTPLFQANFDDAMLREIAEADYGWKADECYALLHPILQTGLIASDNFELREVLDLISVSQPDDPKWSPGGKGRRGHWMRLFACTVQVRLARQYPESFGSQYYMLARLISSAIELGRPVARATAGMLAWRFLAYPGNNEDSAFLAFAILLLAAYLERGEDRGRWLKDLSTWVDEEESLSRIAPSRLHSPLPDFRGFRERQAAVWRSLAHRILARPESPHPREADEALQLLGKLVAGI
jgi:hypothetical protein